MSERLLSPTTSLCPQCGKLLPAQRLLVDNTIQLRRHCPEHGTHTAMISSDASAYLDLSRFHRAGARPLEFTAEYDKPCPGSCGLCPEHEQHVCMPILEITDHCDMACPVCLVRTPGRFHLAPEQAKEMVDRLVRTEGQIDILNLSGGEPTLHPEFREIVDACRRDGVLYLSVSTNGRRLARDPALLDFMAERQVVISLQFDGLDRAASVRMRGLDMIDDKLALIEMAGRRGARMSLTFTAARGVNDHCLHEPIELLFSHDHILSVMFQPMAYVGMGAQFPRPADPLDIPAIARLIDGAAGIVGRGDLTPLPCSHPACFSLAYYLKAEDGRYMSLSKLVEVDRYLDLIANRALVGSDAEGLERIRDCLYDLWSGPAGMRPDSQRAMRAIRRLLELSCPSGRFCAATAASVAEKSLKSVFVHQFMDRHSFDLARCRKCCQVYPQIDGRLMPACVYNCLHRGAE